MKLYIFRHGQTNGNVNNIVQGAGVDIPLNETGHKQAQNLAQKLQPEKLDIIYSSPMIRARETAQTVASVSKIPVEVMPGLEEVHYGEAEGMYSEEAHQKYADIFAVIQDQTNPQWREVHIPGAESVRMSCERIEKTLHRIKQECEERGCSKVGIATHGALMYNLYQKLFGQDRKFDNCEYFIIEC